MLLRIPNTCTSTVILTPVWCCLIKICSAQARFTSSCCLIAIILQSYTLDLYQNRSCTATDGTGYIRMKCDSIPANPRGSDVHLFPPTIWRERISGELVLYDASISMKSRVMIIKKEKAIYELYASSVKPKLVSEIFGYNNLWSLVMNTAAKVGMNQPSRSGARRRRAQGHKWVQNARSSTRSSHRREIGLAP